MRGGQLGRRAVAAGAQGPWEQWRCARGPRCCCCWARCRCWRCRGRRPTVGPRRGSALGQPASPCPASSWKVPRICRRLRGPRGTEVGAGFPLVPGPPGFSGLGGGRPAWCRPPVEFSWGGPSAEDSAFPWSSVAGRKTCRLKYVR